MMRAMIETRDLSKRYGETYAVRNLNLSVQPGRITAFLGLNGAGKSTTIRMLLGMIRPGEGGGYVLGYRLEDPDENVAMRKDVAFVSEDKRLYPYMTVAQMLHFTRGFFPAWRDDLAETLLRKYELPPGRKVRHLSKGMRTKLALILAIARRPKLLILDEPSEGLDPRGTEQLLETLTSECAEGTTVFFSSHQIEEVERISDQICVIHRGTLVIDSPTAGIFTSIGMDWRYLKLIERRGRSAFRQPGSASAIADATQGVQGSLWRRTLPIKGKTRHRQGQLALVCVLQVRRRPGWRWRRGPRKRFRCKRSYANAVR